MTRYRSLASVHLAIAAVLIAVFCAAPFARALDRVTLKDGRVFDGTIVEDSGGELLIETKVAGIPTTVTLRSAEIDTVQRDFTPENTPDDAPEPALALPTTETTPTAKPPRKSKRVDSARATRYLYVPIAADIGIRSLSADPPPITAEGVEAALTKAKRQKLEHVVFFIDSDGGYVKEGERIVQVLEKYRGDFTYYAIVERSISAAMAITLSCDKIFVTSQGAQGGALSYTKDPRTGNAKVDAKMNSIWGATLAGVAERNGHNPDLVRAMVLPEWTVYSWLDSSGARVITDMLPEPSPYGLWMIDDSLDTVLTLSGSDAVKLGFAESVLEDATQIGQHIGITEWLQHGRYGEVEVAKPASEFIENEIERQQLIEQIDEGFTRLTNAVPIVNAAVSSAMSKAPDRHSYHYNTINGQMTGQSIRDWRRRTDEAVGAWNTVLAHITDVHKLNDRMKKNARASKKLDMYWAFESQADADAAHLEAQYDAALALLDSFGHTWNEANAQIKSLKAARNKTSV